MMAGLLVNIAPDVWVDPTNILVIESDVSATGQDLKTTLITFTNATELVVDVDVDHVIDALLAAYAELSDPSAHQPEVRP